MPALRSRVRVLIWMFIWFGVSGGEQVFSHEAEVELQQVVVFGDSLADTGNTLQLTRYLTGHGPKPWFYDTLFSGWLDYLPLSAVMSPVPPDAYFHGRFSNGLVSSESVAKMMGLDTDDPEQFLNLAFGGSWTVSGQGFLKSWLNLSTLSESQFPYFLTWRRRLDMVRPMALGGRLIVPSLGDIVNWYLARTKVLDSRAMYVFSSGSNDYQNGFWDVEKVVLIQEQCIRQVLEAGAKHIGWGMLPDLTVTPCMSNALSMGYVRNLIIHHNQLVKQAKQRIQKDWPDVRIVFVDGYGALNFLYRNASEFGIRQLDRPCTNISIPGCQDMQGCSASIWQAGSEVSICDNPDEYFFWDSLHPTARVYQLASFYLCIMAELNGYKAMCEFPEYLNEPARQKILELMRLEPGLENIAPEEELVKLLDKYSQITHRKSFQ